MRKACEMVRSRAENLQGFKLVFEDLEYEHKCRSISARNTQKVPLLEHSRPKMRKRKRRICMMQMLTLDLRVCMRSWKFFLLDLILEGCSKLRRSRVFEREFLRAKEMCSNEIFVRGFKGLISNERRREEEIFVGLMQLRLCGNQGTKSHWAWGCGQGGRFTKRRRREEKVFAFNACGRLCPSLLIHLKSVQISYLIN